MRTYVYVIIVLCGFVTSMQPPQPPVGLPGCTCPIGITNCGNTCWMDADLQCLFNMDDLNKAIMQVDYPTENVLAHAYKNLYTAYMAADQSVKSDNRQLREFIKIINTRAKFATGVQQDAQEGMTFILDSLAEGIAGKKIKELIAITTMIALKHPESNAEVSQKKDDPLTMLSIPITENEALEVAIKRYFEKETVKGYEYPKKYGFRGDVDQYKYLTGLSEYLIINLKLFEYDWKTEETKKINIVVPMPLAIDMSSFVYEPEKGKFNTHYILQGIVAHAGTSARGGHYIAYVKKNDQWYNCDDSTISPLQEPKVDDFTPYILIYKRAATVPEAVDSYQDLVRLAESLQELSQKH